MAKQKKIKCKLDGKQSYTFPFTLKKNGRLLTNTVEVLVRGFLKFQDSKITNLNYITDEYQKESANLIEDRTIVYPVIFSSMRIFVYNGRGTITLLPRSEDVLQETSTIQRNTNTNPLSSFDIIDGGVKVDENLTDPERDPARIIIQTGVIREPYKISIEITVINDISDVSATSPQDYYGQTIDRGTDYDIIESKNSLFFHEETPLTSNLIIDFYNDEDWIPSIDSLLNTYNKGTKTEILTELSNLKNSVPFGASAMYDAIFKAGEIISETSIESIRKLIYVFTDNESNISVKTVDDVIEEINNINGTKNIPILVANCAIVEPITLSVNYNLSDTKKLNKMCFLTGGQCVSVITVDYLDDVIEIFTGEAEGALGYGTYEFLLDFGEQVYINDILASFYLPDERSNGSWEISTSNDNYSYTLLNQTYLPNEEVSFSNLYVRYIKFKVTLLTGFGSAIGDEYMPFDFPALTSIRIGYNSFNLVYLYLNVSEDEIIPSQITLSVNANDVDSDQIKIGLAKSNSHNWNDFYNDSQPTVDQNGKIVIPSRYSQNIEDFPQEPLSKVDNFTLKTKYGAWDPYASVVVYDINNEIITTNNYESYPREGLIVFGGMLDYNYSDGDYTISILNENNHKIGLKLLNKSTEDRLEIKGLGYMYTSGKNLLPPIEKLPPEAKNVTISPEILNIFTTINLNYIYYDINNDKEDTTKRIIKWYINNVHIPYLDGLISWNNINNINDPLYTQAFSFKVTDLEPGQTVEERARSKNESILKINDKIYCEIKVSDGELLSNINKSNISEVIEGKPSVDQLTIKGLEDNGSIVDRLAANIVALSQFNFHADTNVNNSEIIWYVNGIEFKKGIYGDKNIDRILPGEVSVQTLDIGLKMMNEISMKIIPRSEGAFGEPINSDIYVVKNSIPTVTDVYLVPKQPNQYQNLTLTWKFFDFEIDALDDTSQENMTTVKWYRKNPGAMSFEEVTDTVSLNQITTNIEGQISTVNSSLTIVEQQWKAIITPNDSLDNGIPITSNIIIVKSANN